MNRLVLSIVRIGFVRNLLLWYFSRKTIYMKRICKYLKGTKSPMLQIGCGTNPLRGWLNTGIALKECWYGAYMDAGRPFPITDSSFNYVYSEHLFEHLTYQQGMNMLRESYRILKPGGVIRIATPDLQFLLRLYQEPEKPIHQAYIEYSAKQGKIPATAVYVLNRFHTSWGHQIIYDKETLTALLEEIGFKDICTCAVGESKHPALTGIEGHFKELPYKFDLLETMILEASK